MFNSESNKVCVYVWFEVDWCVYIFTSLVLVSPFSDWFSSLDSSAFAFAFFSSFLSFTSFSFCQREEETRQKNDYCEKYEQYIRDKPNDGNKWHRVSVFIKSVITISTLGVFFGLGSGFGGVGFWREKKIYDSFTNLLFNK